MGQRYGQLSLEERIEIYRLHAGGRSQNDIASALDRAPSTISRELQPSPPRFGRGATSLSGLSNWPSVGDAGMAASSWRARRTCGTAWENALRWDIPRSRSLADWR